MAEKERPKARLANTYIRFFALLYDLIILFCIEFVIFIPVTAIENYAGSVPAEIKSILVVTIAYAYFVGFWTKGGTTTGMRPWKLRVAMVASGDAITLAAASIRFFVMIITWLAFSLMMIYLDALNKQDHEVYNMLVSALPSSALSIVFLLVAIIPAASLLGMIFSKNRQCLHDLAAGTAVYRLQD